MDFKVQRVSKVKPPPVLSSSTNVESKARNKDQHSRVKGVVKPRLPGGKPHGAANSNVEGNATRSATASGNDHNQNKSKQERSYCYAGIEFRPLHITNEGGFSTAIVSPRSDNSKNGEKPQNVLAYEEVTIPSGDFDKINTENILVKSSQTSGSNSALAAFTSDMQDMTHACLRQDDNGGFHQESASNVSGKKPPPMPKPYSKSKEGIDEPDTGRKKTPPPMPKPYGQSRKDETEEANKQQGDAIVDAVYAVVNKLPKSKNVKTEEPEEEEEEPPPPLPMRPNFELEEDLKRSQEDIADNDSKEVTEKSTKGMGIIKTIKKHMRQISDGGGLSKTTDEQKIVDTKTASSEEISNGDDKESKPVKAYLVTDIINQPSTKMFGEPEMYETVSGVVEEDDSLSSSNGLPEGWQEVKDAGGTYYWHVASGTTQWEKPRKLENVSNTANHRSNVDQSKPKVKPELKTVISFPVHSMGWLELEESQVAPHNMSDTIAECISNLARQRKDLWKTAETWGGGKDLRLLLEGDNLKLVDVQSKATLLVQPISKMRVWGAGRDELKDFAYVARDQTTSKHRCHVFRCHGNISGRAIHNKLHEMCNKILAEKKKARENQQQNSSTRQWSDILNTPPKPSLKDQAGFNVKPVAEAKKSFSAKYIGRVEVPKPSGIDVIHNAIALATSSRDPNTWRTCLIEIISFSSVRSIECLSQQVIAEDRIKFVSFIGVAKDVKFCGYITSSDQSPPFTCHVFQCIPNAASFTKALEEACKLRLQSCIDTNPDLAQKIISTEAEKVPAKESKPAAGIKGFLGKLAHPTKLGGKRTNLEPVPASNVHSSERNKPAEPHMSSNQSLVKYYGYQSVSVGTGATAIREAVKAAQGTTLQISNITIASEGITLDDSIKSGLARRLIMSEKISYCGLASDRVHFGVIESQGGGKFICHVFSEYKTPVNTVVEAINRIL